MIEALIVAGAIAGATILWLLVGSVIAGLVARIDPWSRPEGNREWGSMAYVAFFWPVFVIFMLVLGSAWLLPRLVPFRGIVRKVGGFQ